MVGKDSVAIRLVFFFSNSFLIAIIATIGAVFSSAIIAFGFARLHFRGQGFWFSCVMLTMMLPFQVIMIPQFLIFKQLGWVNTILPLTVPYFFGQAFFIFQNMQFIRGIPAELDEAARIRLPFLEKPEVVPHPTKYLT